MRVRISVLFAAIILAMGMSSALAFADSQQEKKDVSTQTPGVEHQLSTDSSSEGLREQMMRAYEKEKDSLSPCTVWDSSEEWIGINSPKPGQTFYYGSGYIEDMWVSVTCFDTWESYYTIPGCAVFDERDNIVLDFDGDDIVDVDSYNDYDGYKSLADLDEGRYELWAWAIPCYSDGSFVEGWDEWDVPAAYVTFYVEELLPPTSLKVKAGSKKVTLRYKKAYGAQKYQIYRSTKKSGGYKKIGTTSSTKYVDRKVQKGQRYYYKVRSYRSSTDLQSRYSKAKRSGKVK